MVIVEVVAVVIEAVVIVEMKSLVMDPVFGVIQTRSIGLQKMGECLG